MIYTSYFARSDVWPRGTVSIAASASFWKYETYEPLVPMRGILWAYKHHEISMDEYIHLYKEQLARLSVHAVAMDLEERILLCYEKPDKFCHRHIVAEWLREAGYEVRELEEGEAAALIEKRCQREL